MILASVVFCLGVTVFAACPSADLTGDCFVDLDDFSLLSAQWFAVYEPNDLDEMAVQRQA